MRRFSVGFAGKSLLCNCMLQAPSHESRLTKISLSEDSVVAVLPGTQLGTLDRGMLYTSLISTMCVCRRGTTYAALTLGRKLDKLCIRKLAFAARPHGLRRPGQHHLSMCTKRHAPAVRTVSLFRARSLPVNTRAVVLECRNKCTDRLQA